MLLQITSADLVNVAGSVRRLPGLRGSRANDQKHQAGNYSRVKRFHLLMHAVVLKLVVVGSA